MNYQKNYSEYMDYVKSLKREKDVEIYYETHHILPRSLGGDDSDENLVLLTYREHYLAHFLLWKIFNNKEMTFSFWLMNNTGNKINFNINSKIYSNLKSKFIENQSKKVICLETGEVFNSLKNAAFAKNLQDGWSIRKAIMSEKYTASGYHWSDYNENIDYSKNKFYGKEIQYAVIRLEDCKKYSSYKEAALDNNKTSSTIFDAASGKIKTANGYHWDKYNQEIDYTKNIYYEKKKINYPSNFKRVICIETGKIYHSQSEAAKDIGYKISGDIGRCCDGKLKSCGGYHWRRCET